MRFSACFLAAVFLLVPLSGCLGLGRGGGDGDDITARSPEDVDADAYNVLYIGHSFGRTFAESLEDYAHTAGIDNHATYIVFSGGASGAPDQLWRDTSDRDLIQDFLDTGEIDVLIMICCSMEFIESGAQSDEAVWNFTAYAVDKNPDIRIGLAMPWKDYPADYSTVEEHRDGMDEAYEGWVNLSSNLSTDYPHTEVFTFHHGAVVYELRAMHEAGELEADVKQLSGPKATSIFTDPKGHAGQITLDAGTYIWLHAVHGVDSMDMPAPVGYTADLRDIAKAVIDESLAA
jgi:hypothetical protein